jgi:recombinational DNA repair protein (RecF pathway)
MQGYILNINRVKDEDLIVTILTKNRLKTLYRFYGARHSNINIGYKIDFEPIYSAKSTMPMLREVLPLSNKWMFDSNRFYFWQQFCKLLFKHLRDVEELDSIYFELLEEASYKLHKQNPKRVILESYVKLLDIEGRLHTQFICFLCDEEITDSSLTLKRSFLPAHQECLFGKLFEKQRVEHFFKTKTSIQLSDIEIDELWNILIEGL